jgi:hypothetical protein
VHGLLGLLDGFPGFGELPLQLKHRFCKSWISVSFETGPFFVRFCVFDRENRHICQITYTT